MALPFALSQFISSPQSHVSAALSKVPDYPKHLTGCLVSGPASSGKTSLLFHYARSVAAITGRPVYFLTSASAAVAGPPLLPVTVASVVRRGGGGGEGAEEGATPTSQPTDPFDLVQMKYVSSIADVVAFAACLHLLEAEGEKGGHEDLSTSSPSSSRSIPRRPAAVVVDGLSSLPPYEASASSSRSFDRRAVEHVVLRALAMLSDATAGAWRKRRKEEGARGGGGGDEGDSSPSSPPPLPSPIALVVAEESAPDGRAPFYLYRRWLPLVLAVRPAHEGFGFHQQQQHPHHQNLLSLAPLPAAAGGASVPSIAAASAAALYSFEGAGLEALDVAV